MFTFKCINIHENAKISSFLHSKNNAGSGHPRNVNIKEMIMKMISTTKTQIPLPETLSMPGSILNPCLLNGFKGS